MLSKTTFYAYLALVLSIVYTGPLFSAPVEVCFDLSMANGSGRGMDEIKGAAKFVNTCLRLVSKDQVGVLDVEKQIAHKAANAIKQTASGNIKSSVCACNISSGAMPMGSKNYLAVTLGSGPEEIEDPGCVIVRSTNEACNANNIKNYIVSEKGARAYCQSKVKQKYNIPTFQVGIAGDPKANIDEIIEDIFDSAKASKPVCNAAVINKQQWETFQERKTARAKKYAKAEEFKVPYGNVITCNDPHIAQKLALVFQEAEENLMCAVPGLGSARAARNPTEEFSVKSFNELFLAKGEKLKFREPVKEPTKEPIQQAAAPATPTKPATPSTTHTVAPMPNVVYQAPPPTVVTPPAPVAPMPQYQQAAPQTVYQYQYSQPRYNNSCQNCRPSRRVRYR
jgi:hypothetical protein